MISNKCNTCGGPVVREGDYYVCEYCRNKWEIDRMEDVHAVDRANAWASLRDGDFERSAELFENIILKDSSGHEAYWGRALAVGGITYVTDLDERKKVPTCNNITEDSFLKSKDVQNAIKNAPSDIADTYKAQAEQIDKIRVEWLEKARKEPAYDVFICFKDSDREHGISRTQDSYDAHELYNALTGEGYRVFFSRVSLRDKVSEQYEPYIYNAIKTAKVMIVFGEKPEYFNAVWLKNEWNRFKLRIEKGEKHKNSLVVVYKNLDPADLPVVLKSRQCMNAGDITFLQDLLRHIKRVVDDGKKDAHLEKISFESGKIAKKATELSVNSVQVREVGKGAIAETSISEKQTLSLVNTYLGERQWDDAKNLVDDLLFDNPTCAEAIWYGLFIRYKAENQNKFIGKLNDLADGDLSVIEKVINCASPEFAKEVLVALYLAPNVNEQVYAKILKTILPFAFVGREDCIKRAFEKCIDNALYAPFNILLTTLKSEEVDLYIDYNNAFARKTRNLEQMKKCCKNVLEVDEGNISALTWMVSMGLVKGGSYESLVEDFERLLKYSTNPDGEVENTLNWMERYLKTPVHADFTKQVIKYYSKDLSVLSPRLTKICYQMLANSLFDKVEYFLNLLISFDKNNADAYWGICLMKIKAPTEQFIAKSEILLKDVPEFNKYLSLVNEDRRKLCINLSKKQTSEKETRENERIAQEKQHLEGRLKQEKEVLYDISSVLAFDHKKKPIVIWLIIAVVSIFAVALFSEFGELAFLGIAPFIVSMFALSVLTIDFDWLSRQSGFEFTNPILKFFIWYFGIAISLFLAIGKLVKINNDKKKLAKQFGIKDKDLRKVFLEQNKRVQELEEQLKK